MQTDTEASIAEDTQGTPEFGIVRNPPQAVPLAISTKSSGKEHGSRGSRPIPPIYKRSEVRGVGRSDARLARSEARLQVTAALEPVPSETRTNEMAFT